MWPAQLRVSPPLTNPHISSMPETTQRDPERGNDPGDRRSKHRISNPSHRNHNPISVTVPDPLLHILQNRRGRR
ncbi:hypothetical protein BJV77DRAFT_268732 [Russula vinacea]|nr:hypothetical protein BJV77DRAFT_268732 [Russula vinacea]